MISQPILIADKPGPRIALVDPAPSAGKQAATAMQLFDSMFWAFQGLTQLRWTKSAPLMADVIVVPQGFSREQLMTWNAHAKIVVEIIVDAAHAVAESGQYMLNYPFKAREALDLLAQLEVRLTTFSDAAAAGRARRQVNATDQAGEDSWQFVESLRTLDCSPWQKAWFVGQRRDESLFWLSGDCATYFTAPSTAKAIRSGDIQLSEVVLIPANGAKPDPVFRARSGIELRWFAGCQAGEELASWLPPTAQFRLTRWPDFKAILPAPSQVRIAAALNIEPVSLAQLMQRTDSSLPEATRTLNALAACNVISVIESGSVAKELPGSTSALPRKRVAAFFHDIRQRLGLGA